MAKVYDVPLINQPNPKLCAVACGAMMWAWRSVDKGGKIASAETAIGTALQTGIGQSESEMSTFYGSLQLVQLGGARSKVPSLRRATGANVRYALQWSPVIVPIDPQSALTPGHVVVVIGHDGAGYVLADPSGNQSVNFGGQDGNEADYTHLQTGILDRTMATFIWYWA